MTGVLPSLSSMLSHVIIRTRRWGAYCDFHSHLTDEQTGSEQLPSCPQVTEHDCGGARISSQLRLIPTLPHGSDLLGPRISRKKRDREREMTVRSDGRDLERYAKEP